MISPKIQGHEHDEISSFDTDSDESEPLTMKVIGFAADTDHDDDFVISRSESSVQANSLLFQSGDVLVRH